MTRPQTFTPPIPIADLAKAIATFQAQFLIADENDVVTDKLLALMQSITIGGKNTHDANIVATMQAYGINELLTHNTGDFLRYAGMISVVALVS